MQGHWNLEVKVAKLEKKLVAIREAAERVERIFNEESRVHTLTMVDAIRDLMKVVRGEMTQEIGKAKC